MSDEIEGWCEAARVLNGRQEEYEEVSELSDKLPDGFRAIEVSNGEGFAIEKRTTYKPLWVPIAEFTDTDAQYEWGDEIHKETGSEYRCVVDHTNGGVWMEVRVDE